jgi:predicted PurR-regulated permease PerM
MTAHPIMKEAKIIYSSRAGEILLVGALALGLVFLGRYIGVFALAALTTLLFSPLYEWFKGRRYLRRAATGLTIVCVTLTLVVPILVLVGLSYHEATQLSATIKQQQSTGGSTLDDFSNNVSSSAHSLGITVSSDSVKSQVSNLLQKAVSGLVDFIFEAVGNIAIFVISAIVYFMALATMLTRKTEIIGLLRRLSPFSKKIDDEYLGKVESMTTAMVKCTFAIAVIVSAISCLTFLIIGIPNIAFWFVLFTILSLIPLGAGIIYVPIGIILLVSGHTWQGILILVVQFVILNNVNNVLTPLLAPKDSRLPGVLVLVSTFAGVGFFGLIGVIYGPILMVLIYTSIELYDRHRKTGLPMKTIA